MGLVGLATAVVAAALAAAPAAAPSGSAAVSGTLSRPTGSLPNSPIFTRQTVFSIPFRVDTADPASRDVAEVQLYVRPIAAPRRPYGRAEPQRGSFSFAPAAMANTGSRSAPWIGPESSPPDDQRARPAGIVDTTAPDMSLEARAGDGGQVFARWQIVEPHLNSESLRIQFRTGPDQPWQTVAIDRRRSQVAEGVEGGEVSWWPQGTFERLEVRGEVADMAGNMAVSHAQVLGGSAAASVALATRGAEPAPPGPRPVRRSPRRETPFRSGQQTARGEVPCREETGRWPSRSIRSPAGGPVRRTPSEALSSQEFPRDSGRTSSTRRGWNCITKSSPTPPRRKCGEPATAVRRGRASDGSSRGGACSHHGSRRGGLRLSPCNGRSRTAGRGIAFRRTSVLAAVAAQLWVAVDLTKPNAKIVSARPLAGPQAGQVDIRWEADDALLAPRPISLATAPAARVPGRRSPRAWRTWAAPRGGWTATCRLGRICGWRFATRPATWASPSRRSRSRSIRSTRRSASATCVRSSGMSRPRPLPFSPAVAAGFHTPLATSRCCDAGGTARTGSAHAAASKLGDYGPRG